MGRGLQSEVAVEVFARSCGSVCNKLPLHTGGGTAARVCVSLYMLLRVFAPVSVWERDSSLCVSCVVSACRVSACRVSCPRVVCRVRCELLAVRAHRPPRAPNQRRHARHTRFTRNFDFGFEVREAGACARTSCVCVCGLDAYIFFLYLIFLRET